MFTGKKARRQLLFWVTLALSAGGTYLPTGTEGALWEMPTAYAANDVTIAPNDTTVSSGISGTSKTGSVTDNHVTVGTAGTANRPIVNYGGATAGGSSTTSTTVSGNVLTINNIWVGNGYIHAGLSGTGAVTGNSAEFKAGTAANSFLYGGYLSSTSGTNAVEENSVTLAGGTVNAVVGGSNAGRGAITKNSATVTGGTVNTTVFGGGTLNTSSTGALTENKVMISGGTIGNNAIGAYNHGNGLVSKNAVTVTNGTVNGNFTAGGYAHAGTTGAVKENTATMSGGQVKNLFGGMSFGTGALEKNKVTFSGGTANLLVGGYATGGNAAGNTVEVSGGTVSSMVYGANVTGAGTATGNKVRLTSGTMGGLVGGFTIGMGNATGNTVEIAGGTTSVIAAGSTSGAGSATGNTVTITGGTVTTGVYGGNATGTGATTGNTVNIGDGTSALAAGTNLSAAKIYGGSNATVTGNTLNVKAANVAADTVGNFEKYVFHLNNTFTSGATMLTVNTLGTGAKLSKFSVEGFDDWLTAHPNMGTTTLLKSAAPNGLTFAAEGGANNAGKGHLVRTAGKMEYGIRTDTGNDTATSVLLLANQFKDNTSVTYTGADPKNEVWGGISYFGNTTENNHLTISGVQGGGSITAYGGRTEQHPLYATGGSVNNSVTVEDTGTGKITMLYGGYTRARGAAGNAVTGNVVTVKKGTVNNVFGGSNIWAANSNDVTSNTVTIDGGTLVNVTGGSASGAGTVSGNAVTMNGGTVNTLKGGETSNASGKADNNTVTVAGGTVDFAFGGSVRDRVATAMGNKLILTGGTFGSGGRAAGAVTSESNATGELKNNEVTITGGSFANNYRISGAELKATGNTNLSNGNVINLGGGTAYTANLTGAELWGTYYNGDNYANDHLKVAGNTLNVKTKGITAKKAANFEKYTFHLASSVAPGETLLTLSETNGFGTRVKWSNIDVQGAEAWKGANPGEKEVTILRGSGLQLGGYAPRQVGTPSPSDDYEAGLRADSSARGNVTVNEIVFGTNRFRNHTDASYDGTNAKNEIHGGISYFGNTTENNILTITGVQAGGLAAAYGGKTETAAQGDSVKNKVIVEGTGADTITDVIGGFTAAPSSSFNPAAKAEENTVTVKGGTVTNVYGGLVSVAGSHAMKNKVLIEGGTVSKAVGGGEKTASTSGKMSGNEVTITGGTLTNAKVMGAETKNPVNTASNGNIVNLGADGGAYGADLSHAEIWGTSYNGTAVSNTDAKIAGNVLNTKAKDVAVGKVYNFETYNFHLNNNIADGDTMLKIASDGFGGKLLRISKITAEEEPLKAWGAGRHGINEVKLIESGAANALKVFGGSHYLGTFGSDSEYSVLADDGTASASTTVNATTVSLRVNRFKDSVVDSTNAKTLTVGTFKEQYGGISYHGNHVVNNTLTVTAAGAGLDAAYAGKNAGTAGKSTDNTVNIELTGTDAVADVYGGALTDAANAGEVKTNHANLKRGEVGNLYAGYTSGAGDVTGNEATITGGKVTSAVYGGYSAGAGKTTGNTVNLGDGSTDELAAGTDLTAATLAGGSDAGDVTGNTLNVKARNVVVDKVKNFETYKFFLHANTPQEATMLTIAQDGFGGSTARIDQDIALDGLAEWSEANKNRIFSRVELIKSGVAGALKLSDRDAYIGAADGLERSVTVDDEATENGGAVEATSVYLRMNRFKDGRQNYNGAEAPVMAEGESEVYGGVSYHGNKTENNELTVTGTPGGGELYAVYGGKTAGAAGGSENNTVNVELGSGKIKNVYGGFIGDEANVADVVGNKVNLKKGEVGIPFSAALYGGYTEGAGTAKDNIVTITGGEAKGFVTGGWAKVAGNATGNRVVLENGKVRQIFGGWAAKKAADNIVSVKNATVTVGVRGAYGKEDTSNNVVTVENSTVRDSVIAAYLESGDVATGNKVRIDGGQVNKDVWGAYGKSGATVTENEVTIKDAAIGDTVFGGHSINAGKASGNTVTIEGSASVGGPVYAGYIQGNGKASNNKLRIRGGTFAKNVYGGYSLFNGKVENNEVTITGGAFSGDVYGGRADGSLGQATGNIVNLGDGTAATLAAGTNLANTTVYGGSRGGNGNTLNVKAKDVTIKTAKNFAAYKFHLTDDIAQNGTGSGAMLTLTAADGFGGTEGWSKIDVDMSGLSSGQEIIGRTTLLRSTTANALSFSAYDGKDRTHGVVNGDYETALRTDTNTGTATSVILDYNRFQNNTDAVYDGTKDAYTMPHSDGSTTSELFAGISYAGNATKNNHLKITNLKGDVDAAYGGKTASRQGASTGNSVTVTGTGAHALKNVYGGYTGHALSRGPVTGNTVTFVGGRITGDIYGGYSAGSGITAGNTVNLGDGESDWDAASEIAGTVFGGSDAARITGNTLAVKTKNAAVNKVKNFEKYEFHLKENVADGDTMLTIAQDGFGGRTARLDTDITLDADKLAAWSEANKSNIFTRVELIKSGVTGALKLSGREVYNGASDGLERALLADDSAVLNNGTVEATSLYLRMNRFKDGRHAYDGSKAPVTEGSAKEVYGGISYYGNKTENNELTVTGTQGGGTLDAAYAGKTAGTAGGSENNTVNVELENGKITDVYGGFIGDAANGAVVTGNHVNMKKGEAKNLSGGYTSGTGDVTKNDVTVTNGTVTGDVRGGHTTGAGKVSENAAWITGGTVTGDVSGGYTAGTGDVTKNDARITGGSVTGDVRGGYTTGAGNVSENDVAVTGGTVTGNVYGGYTTGTGDVTGGSVTLTGGTITGDVYGGYTTGTGATTGNTVNLGNDGRARMRRDTTSLTPSMADGTNLSAVTLYGGSNAGDVTGNTLNVYAKGVTVKSARNFDKYVFHVKDDTATSDPAVTMLTFSGTDGFGSAVDWSRIRVATDKLGSGTVISNVTLLKSATANALSFSNYAGQNKTTAATNGDYETALRTDTNAGTATSVILDYNRFRNHTDAVHDGSNDAYTMPHSDGSTTSELFAGISYAGNTTQNNHLKIKSLKDDVDAAYGGKTAGTAGASAGNSVTVEGTGSHALKNIYGGYVENAANTGDATDNTVTFLGGRITGDIYGSYTTGTGATTGNTVNLGDGAAATLAAGTDLSGVTLYGGSNAGDVTGNTLNVKAKDINVKALRNFDALHFHLGDKIGMGSTMLTLTDNDGLGRAMDWSKIQVDASALSTDQTEGKLTLLKGASVMNFTGYTGPMDHTPAGNSGDYELSLHTDTETGAAQEVLLDYNRFRNVKKKYDGSTPATNGEVYGGISYFGRMTANNELEVTGTPTGGLGTVYGGKTTGTPRTPADYPTKDSKGNKVTVEKEVTGEITNVIGGATFVADGTAEGNAVTVRGGKIGSVHGGLAVGAGGSAKGNKVFIEGGEFKANGAVIGGGGRDASVTGDMSGNEITVTGGRMNSNNWLVGGNAWGTTSQSNNNVINLGDEAGNFNADLEGLSIWGSSYRVPTQQGGTQYDSFVYDGGDEKIAGNTLNVNAKIGKIGKIRNIDKLNFRLNNGVENGETLLELTEGGGFDKVTDLVTMNPSGQDASIKWDNVTATVDDEKLETLQGANTLTLLKGPAQDLHFTGAAGHARTHFTEKYETALYTEGDSDVTRALLFDVNRFKDGQVAYDGTKPLDEVVGGISRFGKTTEENNLVVKGVQARGILAAYGGKTEGAEGGSLNNRLLLESESENSIRDLYGGYVGNARNNGAVKNNKVTLRKGKVTRDVYGGFAAGAGEASNNAVDVQIDVEGSVVGGHSAGGKANENKLEISAVRIGGDVIGGRGGQGKQTRGNTIRLAGTQIAGEIKGGTGGSEGNTLEILALGTTANDFSGIENLNFYLSETAGPATPTLLRLNARQKDIRGLKVGVGFSGAAPVLAPNDAVSLMKIAENGTLTTDENIKNELEGKQGVSMTYKLLLERRGTDELIARVAGAKFNEGTKSLAETRVASHDFYNSGTNMLSHAGVSSAAKAAGVSQEGKNDKYALWAVQGGTNIRAKTGSYVETRGYNLSLGFARQDAVQDGKFTFSPFVEYGRGSYDSYLDDGTHGEGKTSYIGGGLLGKQDMENGSYIEGSLRAGRIKSDYTGNIAGTDTSYDISSSYFGFHLGIGREIKLKGGSSLDTYLKYFYSRQNDASATLTTGERYLFDAVTSSRLRLGLRYTKGDSPESQVYAGVAWEHEFDGEARATYQGMSTPSPSLKGSSAVFELGARFAPKDSNVSYELNLNGWAGKRRGISGGVQVNWAF